MQQAYQGKPLALKDDRIEQILRDRDPAAVTQADDAPPPEPQSESAMHDEQKFLSDEKAKPGVKVLADGVLMTELTAGTGPKPTASDQVQVRYVGRLPDGTISTKTTSRNGFASTA